MFYWQLLIILFAVDIAKKNWNYTFLCFGKGKIYFWRGNFRRGRASWRGAVMAFIPDRVMERHVPLPLPPDLEKLCHEHKL